MYYGGIINNKYMVWESDNTDSAKWEPVNWQYIDDNIPWPQHYTYSCSYSVVSPYDSSNVVNELMHILHYHFPKWALMISENGILTYDIVNTSGVGRVSVTHAEAESFLNMRDQVGLYLCILKRMNSICKTEVDYGCCV